jgi:hypothetical protein
MFCLAANGPNYAMTGVRRLARIYRSLSTMKRSGRTAIRRTATSGQFGSFAESSDLPAQVHRAASSVRWQHTLGETRELRF